MCNLRKVGCSLIADCCDGDLHEIKRDSRGLAGGHATPAHGDKYSEGASRTFYTKYTEYKKRVAHANAGGDVQREVVSTAERISSHVQKVLQACTMNRAPVLRRVLWLGLRAMLGMVRVQRWSYLQRPRPW